APLFYSCWLELLAENWLHGLELADELHELGLATDRDEITARALATRVVLLAHVGDEDGARRGAVEAQRVAERERVERLTPFGLGLLELSLDRPQQALEHVRRERILESGAGVEEPALGGFNWSSQRLDEEELRWEQFGVVRRIVRGGRGCGRRAGRRWGGGRTGSGFGWRSL